MALYSLPLLKLYGKKLQTSKPKTMESIKKQYSKIYGYMPTDQDILSLYMQGDLKLTDKQENQIIKYFNL